MTIVVVGVNHRTAPVEVRERLALSSDQIADALPILHNYVNKGVILSTCNRTEVYCLAEKTDTLTQKIGRFFSQLSDLPIFVVTSFLYTYQGEAAVRHLFRVACGLDSMILGEAQILGQVRGARDRARANGSLNHLLTNLFHHAVRVGRRVRSDTEISRNAASVSSAGVAMARRAYGKDLSSASILVIGAGRMAKRAAKTFLDSGASRVIVANRTYENAVNMTTRMNVSPHHFEELGEALAASDIVLSATAAPDYVLTQEQIIQAMQKRQDQPLYLVDIGVPRNIDPRAGKVKNVTLYDIDDLRAASNASLAQRQEEVAKVEAIIERQVAKFMAWWNSLDAIPTIVALRGRAEAIRQAEMAKTLKRMPQLSEEEQARINALTRSIVNKILHQPIVHLKDDEKGNGYLQSVRQLFDLEEES
jgi:glutamyl-tRNA reductase